MKKIIYLMFYVLITNAIWSQELHLASGGQMTSQPGTVIYVDNNVTIHSEASLTIKSDATSRGSFIVTGNSTGNINYKRFIPNTNWHLVSSPLAGQNIADFVETGSNEISKSRDTDNYAVSYYKNSNAPTKTQAKLF